MDAVAVTGLLVAALRAEESKRADRLFDDPFAEALAGDAGRAVLERYRAIGPSIPIIEVRTRWYDESLLATAASGVRQVVLLAAGMDARAYRLPWPDGTRVFEVDQAEVIAAKGRALADAAPRCERVAIGTDLAGDWSAALEARGFDRSARTVWLVEGLLQYLDAAVVGRLFARLDALSAPGSAVFYDVVGRSLLDAPFFAPTLAVMRELGAPWIFGTDDPAALLPAWTVTPIDPAVVGNAWKRWPFPAAPAAPGAPRGYLLAATKG